MSLMRKVYVAGVGMSKFGKFPKRSVESIGQESILAALKDADISRKQIQEVFCGSSYGGPLIGQRILRDLGMTGLPISNLENACSSGSCALREGVSAVAMG